MKTYNSEWRRIITVLWVLAQIIGFYRRSWERNHRANRSSIFLLNQHNHFFKGSRGSNSPIVGNSTENISFSYSKPLPASTYFSKHVAFCPSFLNPLPPPNRSTAAAWGYRTKKKKILRLKKMFVFFLYKEWKIQNSYPLCYKNWKLGGIL